ncbi:MAG: glycosyltransferase [Solirubrobacterales bacterium]|nr:glycosyltransferase [Solirubrobacterales bacterium]
MVTRPPVVLHAIDSLRTGGAEWVLGGLVAALAEEGLTRNIVVSATADDADAGLVALLDTSADRLELQETTRMADRRFLLGLLRAARPLAPAVVHSHLVGASVNGRVLARLLGVPHVATVHTPPGGTEDSARRQRADGLTARLSARIIAPSVAVAQAYAEAWKMPASRLTVLPSAPPPREPSLGARARVRAQLAVAPGEVLILCVARLEPAKGVDVLLEATRALPDVRVVVAGDGPERERLAPLARTGHAELLGVRDDVGDLLEAADVVCLASRHEALPLSLLEAMRSGRPVVASAVGGIPELLADGAGVLVAPGDAAALRAAIATLADDEALRARVGAAGQARVAERYSPSIVARAHAALYAGLPGVHRAAVDDGAGRRGRSSGREEDHQQVGQALAPQAPQTGGVT